MVNLSSFSKLFCCVFVLAVLFGCGNESTENTTGETVGDTLAPVVRDTATVLELQSGKHCFAYTQNRDTIELTLNLKEKKFTGKLLYNLFEKDKNTGTLNGTVTGDTLLADYTFYSEGMRSVRQVAYLLKGNVLQEGTGSMKEEKGKTVFSDLDNLNFSNGNILGPVDCDDSKMKNK